MADRYSEVRSSLSIKEDVAEEQDGASRAEISRNDVVPEEKVEEDTSQTKHEYITGSKLYTVVFGLTLVGFIIMLDMTIVATVSYSEWVIIFKLTS